MAAARISKATGKPVRVYQRKAEAPAPRGRKPAKKTRNTAREATETPQEKINRKARERRAALKAAGAKPSHPMPQNRGPRPVRRAKTDIGRPRRESRATREDREASIKARNDRHLADEAKRATEEGLKMRAILEAAGIMLPGVVGIINADPAAVVAALAKQAADAAQAAAEVALKKQLAEDTAREIAADKAKAAAEAAKTEPPATPDAAPPTPRDDAKGEVSA